MLVTWAALVLTVFVMAQADGGTFHVDERDTPDGRALPPLIRFGHFSVIISGSCMSQQIRRAGSGAAQYGRVK